MTVSFKLSPRPAAASSTINCRNALRRPARTNCGLESGLFTTCLDAALDGEGRPFIPMTPDLVGDGDLSLDIEIHPSPEPQLRLSRRLPPHGTPSQQLVAVSALSGPSRTH